MGYIKYIAVYIGVIFFVWLGGTVFAKSVSDYEVIQPESGVKCVVVFRMFNTSVDCWPAQPTEDN